MRRTETAIEAGSRRDGNTAAGVEMGSGAINGKSYIPLCSLEPME